MRRYALLGERLGHSYSVPIHQAIFRVLGLEADYRLLEIPWGELGARFPALCRELDGMNVTIPYKEEVMPLLDGVDDFARQVGAVNTVLCRRASPGGTIRTWRALWPCWSATASRGGTSGLCAGHRRRVPGGAYGAQGPGGPRR